MSDLTPKQEQFCQEYLVDLNATQAAIRAGYSQKTAGEQASRLLSNVKVQARVRELQAARGARLEVTQDDVLRPLIGLLQANILHFEVREGKLQLAEGAPADAVQAVTGFKLRKKRYFDEELEREVEVEEYDIRLVPKDRPVELAGKHVGMFAGRQLNVDLSQLTDEQLAEVASGKDIVTVLLGGKGKG